VELHIDQFNNFFIYEKMVEIILNYLELIYLIYISVEDLYKNTNNHNINKKLIYFQFKKFQNMF